MEKKFEAKCPDCESEQVIPTKEYPEWICLECKHIWMMENAPLTKEASK